MNSNTRGLNTEARERLEELLATEPSSLTEPDIEFLRARSSYLSEEQREMLKKFDTAKKEEAKDESDETKAKDEDLKK
jgi:hypothetical protein